MNLEESVREYCRVPSPSISSMKQRFLGGLAGILLFFGLENPCYAPVSWGNVSVQATPSGLNSWSNPGPNDASNNTTIRYEIAGLTDDVTLLSIYATPLTHTISGETLTTTYSFSTDRNGRNGSGIPTNGATRAQGKNNFVSINNFLSPGVTLLYDSNPPDSNCLLEVTSRGRNSEDYGNDSDLTEAPDAGNYQSQITLRLTAW